MSVVTRMTPREFLIVQRRLCTDRRFHTFRLKYNGKISREDAEKFFTQCDELTYNIVPHPDKGVYIIHLFMR